MRIAAVLAATLHNIHESARFKTGAFRFWGCLPVPESSAAEQKMQECLKVRLALEPLTCIRLALAWVNHLPTFQHSMFLSPGIRPPSSESPPSSHSDTALIFLHTAARPPPPPPPSPQPSSPSPQLSATELSATATAAIADYIGPALARPCRCRRSRRSCRRRRNDLHSRRTSDRHRPCRAVGPPVPRSG